MRASGARNGPKNLEMTVHSSDGKHVGTCILPDSDSYGCPYTFAGEAIYLRTIRELVKVGK
jgi:hypothetical protein